MTRPNLIEELTRDLEPVSKALPRPVGAAIWLAVVLSGVAGVMLLSGPLRPNLAEQLSGSLMFAAEIAVACAALAAGFATFAKLGVPGHGSPARVLALPVALLSLWVLALFVGIDHPALEPSMIGKREHCLVEGLFYWIGPFAFGIWLLRRGVYLSPKLSGAVLGASAAAVTALLMQLACMYIPDHALMAHLGPILPASLIGALVGSAVLPRV